MIARPPSNLPQVAADRGCLLGEAPAWHPLENRVYWVDASAGTLCRFDPSAGTSETVTLHEKIHRCVVRSEGGLLLLTHGGALRSWRDGMAGTVVESVPWGGTRLDSAACDPAGRLFCLARRAGSRTGELFRMDLDGSVERIFSDAACAGGLAFSHDGGLMYWADTVSREVSVHRRDPATGALSGRQLIARLPESLGAPHGLALDAKGFLWIPMWGGSCVLRLAPGGKEERRVYFTARLLTGAAFGGEGLRELYVTSAGGDNRKENGSAAGALFRYRAGVRGALEPPCRVGPRPAARSPAGLTLAGVTAIMQRHFSGEVQWQRLIAGKACGARCVTGAGHARSARERPSRSCTSSR